MTKQIYDSILVPNGITYYIGCRGYLYNFAYPCDIDEKKHIITLHTFFTYDSNNNRVLYYSYLGKYQILNYHTSYIELTDLFISEEVLL